MVAEVLFILHAPGSFLHLPLASSLGCVVNLAKKRSFFGSPLGLGWHIFRLPDQSQRCFVISRLVILGCFLCFGCLDKEKVRRGA